jgi:PAS domain S-box-containing protein
MKLLINTDLSSDVLNSLSAQVAVVDHDGIVVAINDAWEEHVKDEAWHWSHVHLGENLVRHFREFVGKPVEFTKAIHRGVTEVMRGEVAHFEIEFPAHTSTQRRWFVMRVTPLRQADSTGGVVVTNFNISQQKRVEEELNYQAKCNSLLNNISNQLFEVSPYQSTVAIENILGQIAVFLRADLAFIHHQEGVQDQRKPVYSWSASGEPAPGAKIIASKYSNLNWLLERKPIHLPQLIKDVGAELEKVSDKRKVRGIKNLHSWAVVPVLNGELVTGSIQFFWLKKPAHISPQQLLRFSMLGEMVFNAIFLKRTELALGQSESKLHSLLSNLPDSIVELNPKGTILYSNNVLPDLRGAEHVVGTNLFEYIPGERQAEFRKLLNHANNRKRPYTVLLPIPHGGDTSWWNTRIIPMQGEGAERKYLVISTDVTGQIKANRALKQSERLYRLLAENMQDMVSQHQTDGTIVWVSQSVTQILGYAPDELIGRNYYDLFHTEDAAYMRNYAHHLTLSQHYNEELRIEYRIKKKSKRYCWFESLTKPIYNQEGKVVKLQITSRDITKRREAEQALQTSKERQELALRGADLGLWDWNLKTGQYIYNGRWAEMLGYAADDIGNTLSDWAQLVHADDMANVNEALRKHLQGKADFYEAELRLLCKDGKWKWIMSRGKVLEWDESGKAMRAVGTHLDITENKKMEATIVNTIVETQENERKRFAKDLHDGVGQYLSAIRLNLNAIRTDLEEDRSDFNKELIGRSNDLLDTTLNDLRSISYNIMPGTLNDLGLIPALEEMLEKIEGNTSITTEFHATDAELRHPSNIEIGLYRILQELVNNTLKHAEAKCISIDLEYVRDEEILRLLYADDGKGLPSKSRKKHGQTGFGLQNMDSRVKSLKGTINFHKVAEGMAVTVVLPLEETD